MIITPPKTKEILFVYLIPYQAKKAMVVFYKNDYYALTLSHLPLLQE